MTTTRHAPDRARARGGRPDLTIETAPHWDDAMRILVRRRGCTLFACSVTPGHGSPWFITDCLPHRRDAEPAALLLAVCDRLSADHGADRFIAITPDFWSGHLAAGGAALMQRVVPMWLPLDEELLSMHGKPLPATYRIAPLEPAAAEPAELVHLSADTDRTGDLRVWKETFAHRYGPVIPPATLQLVGDSGRSGAIAVTEHQGTPLVAHFVIAAAERGSGFGRAVLVESLIRLSRSGYVDCRLNVVADNWVAHRLYRSIGFIQSGPTLRVSHLVPSRSRHA